MTTTTTRPTFVHGASAYFSSAELAHAFADLLAEDSPRVIVDVLGNGRTARVDLPYRVQDLGINECDACDREGSRALCRH